MSESASSPGDDRAVDVGLVTADRDDLFELIGRDAVVSRVASGFQFTEGPTWSCNERRWYFSDIPGDSRYRWQPDGRVELVTSPTNKSNGMTFHPDGSLLACEHVTNAVVRIADGVRSVVCDAYRGVALNSPNDLVVRSADGAIYFTDPLIGRSSDWIGTRRPGELGFAGVYRVLPGSDEPALLVERDEFVSPNGLCFSPDESHLYVNDSRHRGIKRFRVLDDGRLGPSALVAESLGADAKSISSVDGMECDEHGNIWVTSPGGVWVLDPRGRRLGVIGTPENCASLVWGGDDLHTLLLTTTTSVHTIRTRCGPAPLPHHLGSPVGYQSAAMKRVSQNS